MNKRYYSLDVFRGATVALMILVNNQGSEKVFAPLDHALWHGCTPTDLVFPFFLFAVGNAMAFVLPKLEAAGEFAFWKKVIKRTLLIFLIGFLLNWFPFIMWEQNHLTFIPWESVDSSGNPDGVRIFGILQRIAVCYFFAMVIVHYFKTKGAFVVSAVLLLGYWVLCLAANPSDPFSLQGWFGTALDKSWIGERHMYQGEGVPFEPEDIFSSITAIVQVIFGFFVGDYILKKGKSFEMLSGLFVIACVLLFTGYCWDMVFPINKKIWTSSYVIYTTGLAILALAMMIYLIEFKNKTGAWSKFFDVFGKNALFIFSMSTVIPRLIWLIRVNNGVMENGETDYLNPCSWYYLKICDPVSRDPRIGSLLYALSFIAVMWFLAWLLDKKKIYIKV